MTQAVSGQPIAMSTPATDAPGGIPRADQRSAKKLSQFLWNNYQEGLRLRKKHHMRWLKVQSIMRGVHYFSTKGGIYREIPRKPEWATTPIMAPRYRLELGRLNANRIGVTAIPRVGRGSRVFYKARDAQVALETWIDEIDLNSQADTTNQNLLFYGTVGMYLYADAFREQVYFVPIPADELFPIPYYATNPDEMEGIQRVHHVSKGWAERQDEIYERDHGKPPPKLMARAIGKMSMEHSVRQYGRKDEDAAVAMSSWMKATPNTPGGEFAFMLGEEMYRYVSGKDQNGKSLAMPPNGRLPIEIVYYNKRPDDWWGDGFCEAQIAPQLESNRQFTSILKSSQWNRPFVAYNTEAFRGTDIQTSESPLIPFESAAFDVNTRPPLLSVPGMPINRDVGVIMEMAERFADKAAGHESSILVGVQEKRTEGGPATSLLNANAQMPLQPTLDRLHTGYKNIFPEALDMIRTVWPNNKRVRTMGMHNVAREFVMQREDIPASEDVVLIPAPLLADGRNAQLQMLFRLRTMPQDDGTTPELSSAEFRRGLFQLGFHPPGIDIISEPEQRILWRVMMLIGDGKKSEISPAGQLDPETGQPSDRQLAMEDHKLAVELFKKFILDPAYHTYSPLVRKNLIAEQRYHMSFIHGANRAPDNFDDDVIDADAAMMELNLESAELDLETEEGLVTIAGQPIGL